MTSLESILTFISKSNSIKINYSEKGYKCHCYRGVEERWDTPHVLVWIIESELPTSEYSVECEYRKERIFRSDSYETVIKIREAVKKRYAEIEAERQETMKKEFEAQLETLKE